MYQPMTYESVLPFLYSCRHIVTWTLHNWRWGIRKCATRSNPQPCVVVSCLRQEMQAGRGLAHHWRQPIQSPSGWGRSAPVQRGHPNTQVQALPQTYQEPAAGTPSAVLPPTASDPRQGNAAHLLRHMCMVIHPVFMWNRYTDTCMHADVSTNPCTYQP